MSSPHRPGYKREWCDALPTRMRLVGWDEQSCLLAHDYVHNVADVYTGNAWRNFARDVDVWFGRTKPEEAHRLNCTLILPNFPRRHGVNLHRYGQQPVGYRMKQKAITS